MTCIPDRDVTGRKGMQCIVQTHGYDDTAESYTSLIKAYCWLYFSALEDFPENRADTNMTDWIPFSCVDLQRECPWELVTDAEFRQPGVEATDKRVQYDLQGLLVTAGFYDNTMKVFSH